MIVPMTKVSVFTVASHVEETLKSLRKLGLMHVSATKQSVESEESMFVAEQLQMAERAVLALKKPSVQTTEYIGDQVLLPIKEVLSLLQEKDDEQRKCDEAKVRLAWYEIWGGVSLASVKKLRDQGVSVRLYRMAKTTRISEDDHPTACVVAETSVEKRVVLFSLDPKERLEFNEEAWPEQEYHDVANEIRAHEQRLEFIGESLARLSSFRNAVRAYVASLEKQREFIAVKSGAGEDSGVVYVTGFIPTETVATFVCVAEQQPWGYAVEDVAVVDHGHGHGAADVAPPTLLKNKAWASIVNPLFQFMGTVPGYREYDISACFLVFFSLFFAMIVNDASYGVVILVCAGLLFAKAKKGYRQPLALLIVLAGADILWGALVGEWFGSKELAQSPLLRSLALFEHVAESSQAMMKFCFTIGAIHLTVAHLMNLYRHGRSRHSIGQVGWLLIVWPLYFLVCNMVVGEALPVFAMPMLGLGLVLLLSSERTAADFAHAPLAVIGCFSDIISYMRLFAVGFAASIMAKSFNTMAIGDGIHSVGAVILAVVVLVGGHALNLALGFMAVIVHGVRLNLLEFSSHLGQEWTGYEYKPFKE